jgi:NTP pyrophosphatase (non-canonical NTP hydrolase)
MRKFCTISKIGEISAALKRIWSANYESFDKNDLADEIADACVLLIALADQFEIDIAAAVEKKFFDKDRNREWKTAQ